jgi:hypothetical protein
VLVGALGSRLRAVNAAWVPSAWRLIWSVQSAR